MFLKKCSRLFHAEISYEIKIVICVLKAKFFVLADILSLGSESVNPHIFCLRIKWIRTRVLSCLALVLIILFICLSGKEI